ncbi:CAMK family protein kinase [Tritrichomonas foetus]|uniref:CAMK family protein kinase n=1 Tax=Tritrichomonas foetus TaxID=1144522 RepID=A0A1J4JK21_9EUKA|nr:CAMK family protein kinase [Tritrichomonas foetus]|eukprot:OHS97901.1 CAMK family protein kinase [Tritrichomonas foetus]
MSENQKEHHNDNETKYFDPFPNLPVMVRQFSLISAIGHGGYGIVYRAINVQYNVDFAVKVIPAPVGITSDSKTRSYEAEVRSLIKLDHPNVIRIYDTFQENGLFFLVLEYCSGGTLEDKIKANGGKPLPLGKQLTICAQIVAALSYCHKMDIAHRDIKTANVLFDQHDRPKIADFGLSSHFEKVPDNKRKLHQFDGSFIYAPPEILRKVEYDPFKADIWSLGVLFYRVATGAYPWPLTNMRDLRAAILHAQYSFLPPSHPFSKIMRYMLMINPSDRISCEELLELNFFQDAQHAQANKTANLIALKKRVSVLGSSAFFAGLSSQKLTTSAVDMHPKQDGDPINGNLPLVHLQNIHSGGSKSLAFLRRKTEGQRMISLQTLKKRTPSTLLSPSSPVPNSPKVFS